MKKSDNPFFSVVIPSYQQCAFLEDGLRSVLEQNVTGEVLVLDGGSRDGSVDIIRKYESKIDWWRSERDGGQAQAVNEGVRRSKGRVIAWVNSDDMLVAGALEAVESEFRLHPDTDIVIGSALWCNSDGSEFAFWSAPKAVEAEDFSRGYSMIAQPSVFMARKFWEAMGGLDESLHLSLDYDLWVRCLKSGARIRLIDRPLSINRIQPEAKTRDYKAFLEIQQRAEFHFNLEHSPRANSYWQAFGLRLFGMFPLEFVLSTALRKCFQRSILPGAFVPRRFRKFARLPV